MREEVAAGHRAFVVCPLVSESLRVEAKSATEEYERLAAGELAGLRVGLMHGQMAAAAREEVMDRFRAGELEVLVATTVIEVGVDVPEATVMVVESADRFGIAQLHQLRGRVGRGGTASWCYLLGGEEGNERLTAVAASTDGFALAEADLRVRGEGTLLGARQKGQSDLRLASLTDAGDMALLDEARRVAEALVEEDPQLGAHADLADEVRLLLSEDEGEYLFKSWDGATAAPRACLRAGPRPAAVGSARCGSSEAGAAGAGCPPSCRRRSGRRRTGCARPSSTSSGSQGGVEGLTVVDLFCGSGALGVEALSRGAASSTFVDLDPDALAAVRQNLAAVGLDEEPATLVRAALPGWLRLRGGRAVRPRPVRPALRLRGVAGTARRTAGRRRRHGIGGADCPPRGLGGRERAPVRRYARHRGSSQR